MPTIDYIIYDGAGSPQKYVKTIDKGAGTYTNTTNINDALAYSTQAAAQTDATYLGTITGSDRFGVHAHNH